MRLIHGNQAYRQLRQPLPESLALQTLGRHIQEMIRTKLTVVQCHTLLVAAHPRADGGGKDIPLTQVCHLVFHQCNQRRYHQAKPAFYHRRHLKTQALTPTRRHKRKRVSACEHTFYYLRLQRAEIIVMPICVKHFTRGHGAESTCSKTGRQRYCFFLIYANFLRKYIGYFYKLPSSNQAGKA